MTLIHAAWISQFLVLRKYTESRGHVTRLLLDVKMMGRLELPGLLHKGLGSHCPCHEDHLCQENNFGRVVFEGLGVICGLGFLFCFLTFEHTI